MLQILQMLSVEKNAALLGVAEGPGASINKSAIVNSPGRLGSFLVAIA